jgi:hypothetical protein
MARRSFEAAILLDTTRAYAAEKLQESGREACDGETPAAWIKPKTSPNDFVVATST